MYALVEQRLCGAGERARQHDDRRRTVARFDVLRFRQFDKLFQVRNR